MKVIMQKQSFLITCCILIAGILCTVSFFCGNAYQKKKVQIENETNILVKKSELNVFDSVNDKIYVIGHKSPDVDTVASSIACADLLQKLGYDSVPVVLGNINRETDFLLKQADIEVPLLMNNAAGKNIVLVDHSEFSQAVNGVENANILAIFDHHALGNVISTERILYDARPIGAVSTIIWLKYCDYGLIPDKKIATLLMGAILSDTRNFQLDTCTYADKLAINHLSRLAGISDTQAFHQEMYKASISYDGMTDSEIFLSDYKEYEINGVKLAIGCLNAYDEKSAEELSLRMKEVMPDIFKARGIQIGLSQVGILHDGISVTYLVPSDDTSKKLISSAFKYRGVYDGNAFVFRPGMSRKKDLVPALTEVLKSK